MSAAGSQAEDGSPARSDGDLTIPWFALQVRQRYEKLVSEVLTHKGFDHFLPLRKTKRRWCDRVVEMELPLLPGYVFCRLDLNTRLLPVLTTPGVMKIVGVGRTPVPVAEHEVDAIRAIVDSGLESQAWPVPQVGDQVEVIAGPLRGIEGTLVAFKKKHRLVVSVTLLNRAVAVEIDADYTQLVRPPGRC